MPRTFLVRKKGSNGEPAVSDDVNDGAIIAKNGNDAAADECAFDKPAMETGTAFHDLNSFKQMHQMSKNTM